MDNLKLKSVKKNLIYNIINQIVLVIIPIVTTPYISRVLHSYGNGQYGFSFSICSYFSLLAALGFNVYSQREIAKKQNDKKEQSKIFWEIMIVKFFSSFISLSTYIGIIHLTVLKDYIILLYILSGNIIGVAFDITFIFQGNEDFKQLALRNIFIRILALSCVFIFVKKPEDVWVYALINSSAPVASALLMIPFLKKYLIRINIKDIHPIKHVKPCLILFVSTIAISLYTMLDKTMLGILVKGNTFVFENGIVVEKKISDIEVGIYDQAEKIPRLVVTFLSSFSTVLLSRNAFYFSEKRYDELKQSVLKGVKLIYFMSIPMTLGIICISNNFSPWFYGEGYEKLPGLLNILAFVSFFGGLNVVFGNQYLLAIGKDKEYTGAVIFGGIINVSLNAILIPKYQAYGAAFSSVIAEVTILVLLLYSTKDSLRLSPLFAPIIKYLDAGIIMFIITFIVSMSLSSSILNSFIIMITGIVIYGLLMILFKEEYTMQVIRLLKNKMQILFKRKQ